jgi:hypothetical protein
LALATWLCLLLGFSPAHFAAPIEAEAGPCCNQCACCVQPAPRAPITQAPARASTQVREEAAEARAAVNFLVFLPFEMGRTGSAVRPTLVVPPGAPIFARDCALLI